MEIERTTSKTKYAETLEIENLTLMINWGLSLPRTDPYPPPSPNFALVSGEPLQTQNIHFPRQHCNGRGGDGYNNVRAVCCNMCRIDIPVSTSEW